MSKIKRFEDIESWKGARKLTKQIYQITSAGRFMRDFGLKDQIRRASISTLSNIAEGFERGGDQEFRQFLSIAKSSCGKVRAQLYVALDQDYLSLSEVVAKSNVQCPTSFAMNSDPYLGGCIWLESKNSRM